MNTIISVVIPTWQRPDLLVNCLRALAEQRLDPDSYEIIVVSDGPDEAISSILNQRSEALPVNLYFYYLSEKRGPAAARNLGWKMAKGPLIAFTDDDCLPEEDWLKNMVDGYNREEYIAFSGKVIVPLPDHPTDHELNISHLETAEFITANCAVTKKALQRINGFDERYKAAWREDSDLEFSFIQQRIPVVKVENAVVIHPVRKAGWGNSLKEQKKGMFNALLYKKFPTQYRSRINAKPPLLYYTISGFFILIFAGLFSGSGGLAANAGIAWGMLVLYFAAKRLSRTSHSLKHVLEMIFTSMLIPFLSIFWHLYGQIRFRILVA